jgi:5-oxoprolinase (ATP-hydrolysing)
VAAGGGSRLFFKNGLFKVGPESAGAEPGPVCYKKNGYLAITDANLLLGRLIPKYFPKIFGETQDQPLDYEATKLAFETLSEEINAFYSEKQEKGKNIYEIALGYIKVANETMCRAIRSLTQARGLDPKNYVLSVFGGAGAQHACQMATALGMKSVFIHRLCGILSAYGINIADVAVESEHPLGHPLNEESLALAQDVFKEKMTLNEEKLKFQGFSEK